MRNLDTEITRSDIARKIRNLRVHRGLTQTELSKLLNLSQNRLSEIERGQGSFTAEQFLVLLKYFNVPLNFFISGKNSHEGSIQNALARLGASHLVESVNLLPSERLEEVEDVVREVLVAADSPRHITALTPILINNIDHLNLTKLWVKLREYGLERRLAWLIENTLDAILRSKNRNLPRRQAAQLQKSEVFLASFLNNVRQKNPSDELEGQEDILGTPILSQKTLQEVRKASSSISRRWGIISNLQPEDFLEALNASHLTS